MQPKWYNSPFPPPPKRQIHQFNGWNFLMHLSSISSLRNRMLQVLFWNTIKVKKTMFSIRTNSLLLLSTSLFISSTIGTIADYEYGVVSWAMRRSVLEDNNAEHVEDNSSLVLAASRTHRKDPLDDFKCYKGGWNIKEKHYFSVSSSLNSMFCSLIILYFVFLIILFFNWFTCLDLLFILFWSF